MSINNVVERIENYLFHGVFFVKHGQLDFDVSNHLTTA